MTHSLSERRPNFFIVGAPKCGTTAMDAYLKAHPDIFIPDFKELHYFGSDLEFFRGPKGQLNPTRSVGREEDYLEFFEHSGEAAAIGESSVYYLYSRMAAKEIFEFNPDSVIVMMLRNPLDALPSYHSQLFYQSDEVYPSLEDALHAEDDRRRGLDIPKTTVGHFKLFYRDVYAYSVQVERYLEVFPRNQLAIILYDDFAAAPHVEYKKVLSLLGLDVGFRPEFRVLNPNKEARSRRVSAFLRKPPRWAYAVAGIFPASWNRALKVRINAANTRYRRRAPIDDTIRERLRGMLEPEIRRLETVIGRDLRHWLEN